MVNFYVISTPIGNLNDISKRAIDTLKSVDLVLCEDTRVTRKLLNVFDIKKPLESYHKYSKPNKVSHVLNLLSEGKNLALVSDAGTPAVSDPGSFLISEIVEKFNNDVNIIPIPGPSAVLSAISVSGFLSDKFKFFGFVPHKKGRRAFFEEISKERDVAVFFESKHRIEKTLRELSLVILDRKIVLCRELTKAFETIYRGTSNDVLEELKKSKILGEFVIVVDKID